ncbi:MAG TPA: diguanylate cyclase [Gaiellaceae bacterium]|nr:diguanylate cyclase [Gaiellaceae bacterium]
MALVVGAGLRLAQQPVGPRELIGVVVFVALTLLAELRPVPVDLEATHVVSLAFIFVVASQLLYSWEWSVLIGATAMALAQLPGRVPAFKLVFNSAVYAVAAATASLPEVLAHAHPSHTGYGELTAFVFASGAIFVITNVILVCIVVALATGGTVREILREYIHHSAPAFSIMIFLAAQAVIFWRLSPPLIILVGAPLFTLNLYQRSSIRGRVAAKAAATDSLTALKNHRAYQEEIETALATAAEEGTPYALCMIDVDRFKQVNDRYGHPAGDAVLHLLGSLIEEIVPGQGYRLGGDEFAILVPGEAQVAGDVLAELQARFRISQVDAVVERPTISSGIATYPVHATEPAELKKCADLALYQSKHNGKDCVSVYTGAELLSGSFGDGAVVNAAQDMRLQTAERLVAVVDARDAYVGRHSQGVGQLVESIGAVLGLDPDELRQLRLAGMLHDLGKIGVPDEVLNHGGPLSADQEALMRKHPEIGYELLDGLDLDPVDTWVLHHHEHWDGSGYPHGLAGEEIPFGSRIILVADAFEAMTTHRSYRRAIGIEAAMSELRENAGTQFDPDVVAALELHLSTTSKVGSTASSTQPTWST